MLGLLQSEITQLKKGVWYYAPLGGGKSRAGAIFPAGDPEIANSAGQIVFFPYANKTRLENGMTEIWRDFDEKEFLEFLSNMTQSGIPQVFGRDVALDVTETQFNKGRRI